MRDESGSVGLQVVVVYPFALLLILIAIQAVLWQHGAAVARAAAQDGARAARLEGATAQHGEARARSVLEAGGQVLDGVRVRAQRTPERATVEVSARTVGVVPFFRPSVHAVAASPTERFRPPDER